MYAYTCICFPITSTTAPTPTAATVTAPGLIDPSIKRSRAGIRAVLLSLLVLGVTALIQVAIFASACVAGNMIAAVIRSRAGRALDSPALVADGNHARADGYVSLAVVASAIAVAVGLQIADPLGRLRGAVPDRSRSDRI